MAATPNLGRMVVTIYALVGALGLFSAVNAVRSPLVDSPPIRRPQWLPAMLATEMVPIRLAWRAAMTWWAWSAGALSTLVGQVTLGAMAISSILLLVAFRRSLRTQGLVTEALRETGISHDARGSVRVLPALVAYPYLVPRHVERIEDIEYAPGLRLDIYRRRGTPPTPAPTLLHIHGGGWHGGNRRQTARPLLHRTAERGWIAVAVEYPLAPAATWPDPMIALKQAVAWLKTEGGRYGVDPDAIVVTGGSAGGHLASHLALSAGDPRYQPGFEELDLSVAGAAPLYGIFDLLNRHLTRDPWPFIGIELMKSTATEDEARWRAASPLDLVRPDAPPFFVIHGIHDSLVPSRESEQFAMALKTVSDHPVVHLELPGATHAFDTVPSLRTQHVVAGVLSFIEAVVAQRSTAEDTRGCGRRMTP